MFDLKKTLDLIKGGLLDPLTTWKAYHDEDRNWKETVVLLTGPLIVGSVVCAAFLSWAFRSFHMFAYGRGTVTGLLMGILFTAVGLIIVSFIFGYLAGRFGGEHNFNRAFSAVSLASIPGHLGTAIGGLPWIGWLVSLVLGITSMVFLYRIIPLYLKVPDNRRVIHFVLSLLASFIVMLVSGAVVGVGAFAPSRHAAMMGG